MAQRTRRWHPFLDGYAKVRALNSAGLAATNVFVPIGHSWFVGLHSQLSEVLGLWVDDEYFDVHIGLLRRRIEGSKLR